MEVDSEEQRLSIDVGLIRNVVEGVDGKSAKGIKGSPSPRTKAKSKNNKVTSGGRTMEVKVRQHVHVKTHTGSKF